jgi:uncharacterized protein (DUF4213/DUF364 family)
MSLKNDLLAAATRVAERMPLPRVAHVHVPDARPAAHRDAEFGLVALADGSAGLYYAWMGASQADMAQRYRAADLVGVDPLALARRYATDDDAERSLALAALGAITACVHARAGYVPPPAVDSMAGIRLDANLHLGMVGNFPPLVRRAREAGVRVTVVERKAHMVRTEPGLEISLVPAALDACGEVIVTGATLINDSLDEMLGWCRRARRVTLIGPTAGVFPDVLFARGIAAIGGLRIVDADVARTRMASGERLGDSAQRYLVEAGDYPGLARLLGRC